MSIFDSVKLKALGNILPALVIAEDRPTTEKTRFVANGQHVLRVDQEKDASIGATTAARIMSAIEEHIASHDVLVLSDYAKGVLTDEVIGKAIGLARRQGVKVVVDPKSRDLARYAGATVITPNAREIEAATGVTPADDAATVAAAEKGLEQAACEAILVTRAERGMALVRHGRLPVLIASEARAVFDVVGAGDTVAAMLSLALGAGGDLEESARLANIAAGVVVGRRGTSTLSRSDLLYALAQAHSANTELCSEKVVTASQTVELSHIWRHDGLRVGFTNGCFDILHRGHVDLLRYSRRNCDRLIVGINSDDSVHRLKGPDRPFNRESDRAEVLAALDMVDAVVVFAEDTPQRLIERLEPDVLVKGADYALEQIVGADLVLSRGGTVLRFDLVPGHSSTNLIALSQSESVT